MNDQQRAAMQQALEALEALQGGCTDHDDGTVEAITVWCPEIIEDLRAALAEQAECGADQEIEAAATNPQQPTGEKTCRHSTPRLAPRSWPA